MELDHASNKTLEYSNEKNQLGADPLQQSYGRLETNLGGQSQVYRNFVGETLKHDTGSVSGLPWNRPSAITPEARLQERDKYIRYNFGQGNQMVARAQAGLSLAGYDLGDYGFKGVDGEKGPKTTQAVIDFQKATGLKPTGKLDQETMRTLDLVTAKGFKKKDIDDMGRKAGNLEEKPTTALNPEQKKEKQISPTHDTVKSPGTFDDPDHRRQRRDPESGHNPGSKSEGFKKFMDETEPNLRSPVSHERERDKMVRYNFGQGDQTVAGAQASLAMAGYDLGNSGYKGVDGEYGPKTAKAVAEFQKAAGLNPTGKLDQETEWALDRVTRAGLKKADIEQIGKKKAEFDSGLEHSNPQGDLKHDEAKKLREKLGDTSKAIRYGIGHKASQEAVGYLINDYNKEHKTNFTYEQWKEQAKLHPVEEVEKKLGEQGKYNYNFEKELEKFPHSYRPALQKLHESHPNWHFEAFQTKVKWNDFIAAESKGGHNLVNYTAKSIPSSWVKPGSKEYSVGWKEAAQEVVAHYGDPRNFLNEKEIFQFEKLYYNPKVHKIEGVKEILKGTFMEKGDYAQYFMKAAESSRVSPYYLASKARLEMGRNGCSLSTGFVKGYEGFYNFYNIGSFGSNPEINGAIRAKDYKWNSPEKAIVEGAKFCAKDYVYAGQETMYESKFDLIGTKYTHEYVQNVQAAHEEGRRYYDGHVKSGALDSNIVIKIPVFEGMPDQPLSKP